jgi:hypothetical protein
MNRQCKFKISISPKTLHWIYDWMKMARMLLPHMSKTSQVVWTTLQIAAKDSEFHPSFMNLQRNCRRPCQQLQTVNLQASSSTQTALIVLTTARRSMHYLALSQIHLRHICVATAWEQLLGSFCSCCFHNIAALDNSMSANCRTSRPRYKRPTSYLCGIARFINTKNCFKPIEIQCPLTSRILKLACWECALDMTQSPPLRIFSKES